ncbi:MAG: acyl-CoA dehydrogenase, partial [Gammaproteobacteria bacterium]
SLLDTPAPKLTKEEKDFLEGPTEELCRMVDDWQITHHERRLPDNVWNFMRSQRFFGMIIPKQYGGLEFSALAHSSVVMKLASRSVSAAVTVMVPNSLGPAELLLQYGTEEQKDHYLPRLAIGEEIPCFALTGPEAGSDASSIPDTGIVCHDHFDGRDNVLGIRLNWKKRYITLAPVATLLGLAFRLQDPENLLGKGTEPGITCALIPTDTPGVEIGRRHYPLNIAFQNGPNEGHDVFIPVDWIIGGAKRAGQGWQMLMESLAAGRSISLPALSTAAGKTASRMTGAYSRIREQFGLPIGKFEGIEAPLARIASNAYMMDAARTMTLGALDDGHHPSVISAIIKQQLTERMRIVINDAMDIHGGSGICMGPRNLFGRVYQSLPIAITVEGANILTRTLIIFGQGAIRCHPYIYAEMKTTQDNDHKRALKDFDHLLFSHLGMIISNASRALWLGLTHGRTAQVPVRSASRRYLQQLDRMSAAFALVADASMLVLGGSLKRKEHLSARLADIFSLLYMTSATIKRFEDQGKHDEDIPLLKTACHEAFYTMQEQLYGVIRNFPVPLVAFALRWLVFPRGKAYSAPYDQLLHDTATLLLSPSNSRDRLTEGIFISRDVSEQTGRLEEALIKVITAQEVEKKMKQAIRDGKLPKLKNADRMLDAAAESNLFDDREIQLLRAARIARLDAIQVDDLSPELDLERNHNPHKNHTTTVPDQRKLMA